MKNYYKSPLLIPISVGSMKLKNRLVTLPMGMMLADEHGAITGGRNSRTISYYEEKAKGGFALIIAEGDILSEDTLESEKRLVERVHQHGAKIITQIGHPGRQITVSEYGVHAPSPIPCMMYGVIPEELTVEEIKAIEQMLVHNAMLVQKAGYDGVEIHAAHGYLLAEFMSYYANKRFDEYGGCLENRMRLVLDTIHGIREACGPDFTLFFRISADEFVPGGRTIEETKAIAIMLEKAGVDCIDISGAVYGSTEEYLTPMNKPVGYFADFAGEVKSVVNIPVLSGNRINDPHIAESIVMSGKSDLVGMGRQSMADPHLPNKFFSGHSEDIRFCLGCNQGCVAHLFSGDPVQCMVNPSVGKEYLNLDEKKVENPKNVIVVGGGPGGMNAAIGAAQIGHKVTLYEKSGKLGGNFAWAPIPPAKGEMANLLQWQIHRMKQLGVQILLNAEFTPETYEATKPDALIIATGSNPSIPPIPGIDKPHVATAVDILSGKVQAGKSVVIAGGGMIGAETATHLRMEKRLDFQNRKVTVVEMLPEIAKEEEYTRRILLLEMLEKQKVKLHTSTKIKEIKDTCVVVEYNGMVSELPCDTVVVALGYKPNNTLYESLKDKPGVTMIGDAKKVRNALDATHEGFEAGIAIE